MFVIVIRAKVWEITKLTKKKLLKADSNQIREVFISKRENSMSWAYDKKKSAKRTGF